MLIFAHASVFYLLGTFSAQSNIKLQGKYLSTDNDKEIPMSDAEKKRILIVDDEQHMQTSLSLLVRRLGHMPLIAENGREALNILIEYLSKRTPIDLMICDLQMPVLSGDKLVAAMRKRKIQTPVLVITGICSRKIIVNMMRLGCRDFVDKPFVLAEIDERIRMLLKDINSERVEKNRSEYMAKIGELSRGAFHDINNMVGATLGYTDMLLNEIDENHPIYYKISRIFKSASRTAEICREILNLNPFKSESCKVKTDLTTLVEKIAALLADLLPTQYSVTTSTHQTPVWYSADAWQLQHAILNLGFNAVDAMPGGGEIKLAIEKNQDKRIVITIEDEGTGITEDIREKIFDNGYTTKSEGHGIGLASVKRVVEEHNGTISAHPAVGQGTCFKIVLPEENI